MVEAYHCAKFERNQFSHLGGDRETNKPTNQQTNKQTNRQTNKTTNILSKTIVFESNKHTYKPNRLHTPSFGGRITLNCREFCDLLYFFPGMINDSIFTQITYYSILPAISPHIQDIRLTSPKLWTLDCFEILAANCNVK